MPSPVKRLLALGLALTPLPGQAQTIVALPDQTSTIRLSNRDINHVICAGGEIEDVKFSAEKAIAVERAGSDAWIKFLVREIDDAGMVTRSFVTTPSEFFVTCNGAVYPLYAEPSDIPAQTVMLQPGTPQRARANEELLGPLVEVEVDLHVGDLQLVEAEQARFLGPLPGDDRDRVAGIALPRGVDAGVRLQHELVEVDADAGMDVGVGIEEVHQHGLAPPHRPPKIDTPHRL